MACQPSDCVREHVMELEAGATESAIRQQKGNLPRALEDTRCHPTSQCEHIGHVPPEAAVGGVIDLVEGDITESCVQEPRIYRAVSDTALKKRRTARTFLG